MCSMSSLRKTVQFNNSFVELILAVCDHYHDPTSSPACSYNVADLFPHSITISSMPIPESRDSQIALIMDEEWRRFPSNRAQM